MGFLITTFFLLAGFFAFCISADLELPPPPPPPPPDNSNQIAMANDITQLRAQVVSLQNQINSLYQQIAQINQSVASLTLSMNEMRAILVVVAQANSFDEARRLVREKLGIQNVDQTTNTAFVDDYIRNYFTLKNNLQSHIKSIKAINDKFNKVPVQKIDQTIVTDPKIKNQPPKLK
jgi:TolA-binding protein